MRRSIIGALAMFFVIAVLTGGGCGGGNDNGGSQRSQVNKQAASFRAYIPHNHVELNNYNNAQRLYDSPTTIIWCSTTWGNPSSPIITVPITGKLTSSSTTFFQPEQFIDRGQHSWQSATARSVDGLFHPNPPQYRYGFTPGGQYVDFFNMPTVCTTAMSKFQRQKTAVTTEVDPQAAATTRQAEAALRAGKKDEAQRLLNQLGSTQAGG